MLIEFCFITKTILHVLCGRVACNRFSLPIHKLILISIVKFFLLCVCFSFILCGCQCIRILCQLNRIKRKLSKHYGSAGSGLSLIYGRGSCCWHYLNLRYLELSLKLFKYFKNCGLIPSPFQSPVAGGAPPPPVAPPPAPP